MLFFAKNLRRFIPGAYIQYVRFAGKDRAGEIMTEHEFKSNLCTTLQELYRNIVVAEAMMVLGFVNRHSRGVQRVQKDLKELGYINPKHSKVNGVWQLLK